MNKYKDLNNKLTLNWVCAKNLIYLIHFSKTLSNNSIKVEGFNWWIYKHYVNSKINSLLINIKV